MRRFPAFIAVALLAVPSAAQQPALSLEQRTLLRCSAAFAIIANEQQRGVASALAYPPLAERGREYFVRSSARLVDELQVTREQVEVMLRGEVEALQAGSMAAENPAQFVDQVMQPCLLSLAASGL
jgi:hypothetical protein